jgi:hypothetical protein
MSGFSGIRILHWQYLKNAFRQKEIEMKNAHRALLIVGLIVMLLALTACGPAAPTAVGLKQALVGSWTTTVTKEDILRVMPGFEEHALCDNTGTFVWKFNADGTFTIDQTGLPSCPTPANTHVEDKWSADGNVLTMAGGTPDQETYEVTINGDQLLFKAKQSGCIPCIAVNTANPWKRVE